MTEAAGAAAGQHQTDRRVAEQSGEPRQVAGMATAKLAAAGRPVAVEPGLACLGHAGVGCLQQHQLGGRQAGAVEQLGRMKLERRRFVGVGQQHDAVRLTQAEPRPGRRLAVGPIEDQVMRRLDRVEPVLGVHGGAGVQQMHALSAGGQRLGQRLRQLGDRHRRRQRQQGDGAGRRRMILDHGQALQPFDQLPGDRHHRRRMFGHQPVETGLAEA